ncbi:MAG: AAA family ATPase, partial [Bacteroidota bacterium]
MLKTLSIKNFALINSIDLEFSKGLNIITGETGAGKSIIVDALMVLLGERAGPDLIRQGEPKSVIEGTFQINIDHSAWNLIHLFEIESDSEEIILRRELNLKGTSRCFINDSPVQVSQLKRLGDLLVDFHGQHEHQSLLNRDSHINILDIISNNEDETNKYTKVYDSQKDLIEQFRTLLSKEQSLRAKENSLKFELEGIEKIKPQIDEDKVLETELKVRENFELLLTLSNQLQEMLSES